MQAIGELLTSHGTVAASTPTPVAYQFREWTAALQASGRVLRENATTFNPFRDQPLQIHGGCLASDSVGRGDGHVQPLPDRFAPGQGLLGLG